VIVIILVVWWALARSAETYEDEFEIHHEEEGNIYPVPETTAKPDDLTTIE